MTIIKHAQEDKFIRVFYIISIVLFSIYIFLYINDTYHLVSNIYAADHKSMRYGYRLEGPTLLVFILFPFLYIIYDKKYDFQYLLIFILGFISLFLNGSFLSIILFAVIHIIGFFKFSVTNIFKFATATLLAITVFYFIALPRLHTSFVEKLSYISNPWEYPTIKTRLNDLDYMLDRTTNDWREILIGSGVGVKSIVYRVNKVVPALSDYYTFLEIDNGYFYIYHRAGIIGLFLLLAVHVYLILKHKNMKIRMMFSLFFFVFLLISNHFFTDAISALFVGVLVFRND